MAPHSTSSSLTTTTTPRPILLLLLLLLSTTTTLALTNHNRDALPAHRALPLSPLITPTPSLLLARQDPNPQIQALSAQLAQISEASRAVSRASQQVSQSSQQLSQSLAQASQRLGETERQLASVRAGSDVVAQASRSLSQQVGEASRRLDEARRSADQAVSAAERSGSEALAAATRSFAEVMARATAAAEVVQKAQATGEAAAPQQQQVDGAQVNGTTIALAVVGAVVGSAMITAVAFVLFVRFRRDKDRLRRRGSGNGSGSRDNRYSLDKESIYSTDDNGFRADVKVAPPGPVAVRGSIGPSPVRAVPGSGRGGVGYALSYYGPYADEKGKEQQQKKSGSLSGSTAVGGTGFKLGMPPKPPAAPVGGGGRFALFPTSPAGSVSAAGMNRSAAAPAGTGSGSGSDTPLPSLDAWIRAGTVSPFGALKKAVGGKRGSLLAK